MGNRGKDKNLSPYAFTKSKNLELLENLKNGLILIVKLYIFIMFMDLCKYQKGKMATVIGIFEECFKKNIPLPIVRPGSQSRRFTHINDTVEICYKAWKKNLRRHYSISHKKSYTIIEVANLLERKKNFYQEEMVKDMQVH